MFLKLPSAFYLIFVFVFLANCGETAERTQPAKVPQHNDQVEITERGLLLKADGTLRQAGWARKELLTYNPEAIQENQRERLREWDFFSIHNSRGSLSITVTNIGFLTLCSVDWLDFASGELTMAVLPQLSEQERIVLSRNAYGETSCSRSGAADPVLTFSTRKNERLLKFDFPATSWGPAMRGEFIVREDKDQEYLALATPFLADPYAFFYEQKIPGTETEGSLEVGLDTYGFSATDTVAFMDWGRGVWPEQLLWRWGAAGGRLSDGRRFGLNLGNGFGDTSYASANVLIIEGKAHKLGEVAWVYDRNSTTAPWSFRSADQAIDLTLTPTRVQAGGVNLVLQYSDLRKAHGHLRGTIRLAGGEVIQLDTVTAFAEEMQIRW